MPRCAFRRGIPYRVLPALIAPTNPCRLSLAEFSNVVCMPVTSHLFEAYLKCPTKCFLRSLGETGTGNEYADWVHAQNTSYLHAGITRLTEGVANSECVSGPLGRRDLTKFVTKQSISTFCEPAGGGKCRTCN